MYAGCLKVAKSTSFVSDRKYRVFGLVNYANEHLDAIEPFVCQLGILVFTFPPLKSFTSKYSAMENTLVHS